MLIERPSDDWPVPDDRPRTPWLNIKLHGEPVHPGAYEVARYPYFKTLAEHPKHNRGEPQVQLMQWNADSRWPFFQTLPGEPRTSSLSGYSGWTWYRGLANKEDSV